MERWRRPLGRLPGGGEARRFLAQLHSPNRGSALRTLVDGVFVVATLETRGLGPLLRAGAPRGGAADVERALRVAAAVDAAFGLIPVAPSCLRRSVTLLRELHRLGLDAAMHIGVRTGAGPIDAHAWVQVGDVVVNDDPVVTAGYAEVASGQLERIFPVLG